MSIPYFPLYGDDFEADTAHLTMAEDGAYNRLLRLCWRTPGCTIPDENDWIFRRMRATTDEDKAVVLVVLSEFFVRKGGRVHNPRLTLEWKKAHEAHERRVSAGSKGGAAKARNFKDNESSNAKAKPKQPEPEPDIRVEDTNVSLSVSTDPHPANDLAQAVAIYNAAAERQGWPKVQKMTPSRSKSLRSRLRDVGGLPGWAEALAKAEASDFLCGRTSNPWTAFAFDWLSKPANFTKIMEGNYDNRPDNPRRERGHGSGTVDAFAAVAAQRARGRQDG